MSLTFHASTLSVCERMPPQGHEHEWEPDSGREEPVGQAWQLSPDRQVRPVIHIECREEQDIGGAHSDQVDPNALAPHGPPGDERRSEGKRPENEQVVILSLSYHDSRPIDTKTTTRHQ